MNKLLYKIKFLIVHILCVLLMIAPLLVFSKQEGRQIVIIVDSSGSMNSADPASYSIQIAKIINDISSENDDLTLITFRSGCTGINTSANMSGGNGKSQLFGNHIRGGAGGTEFSIPIANSVALLKNKNYSKKMLLIISDEHPRNAISGKCKEKENLEKLNVTKVALKYIYITDKKDNFSYKPFSQVKTVDSSQGLIEAVASIYQNFMAKAIPPQSGHVINNNIEININNYVKNAYLVILSEGKVGKIIQSTNNHAKTINNNKINLNYKKGETVGTGDKKKREYKIVRLVRPKAGKWSFSFPNLPSGTGWMVIQEYSVGIEFITKIVAEGVPITIRAKLIDEMTKKSLPIDSDMVLTMKDQNGKIISFSRKGDIFVATITPTVPSSASNGTIKLTYTTTLTSTKKNINKKQNITVKVEKGSWIINPKTPSVVTIGKIISLDVNLTSNGNSKILRKPTSIEVKLSTGKKLRLKSIGGLKYRAIWKPKKTGKVTMVFSASGGNKTVSANSEIEVVGDANFGKPIFIDFGKLHSNMTVNKVLDLSNVKVFGTLPIKLKAIYNKKNSSFEINQKGKWLPIGGQSELILQEGGPNKWDIRIVVKGCPEGILSAEKFEVKAWFNKQNGAIVETNIPVKIEIKKDPWLVCWWLYILSQQFPLE